ncbi:hypothetical protein H4Q26_000976 [Puccinia striiformis f. sp. tritici PST-130]|nr:hypothetical protein H4Q26_000976 [Puccinia striiformis f. sp. tritici PST-130]
MKIVFLLPLLVGQYVAMEVTKDLGSPQRSPLARYRSGQTTFESPPIMIQLRPDDASSSSAPPPHRVLARQGDTDRKISELEEIVVEQEGSDAGIPNMVDTRTEAQVTARAKIQGIDPTPGTVGAKVIATASSQEKLEFVRKYGGLTEQDYTLVYDDKPASSTSSTKKKSTMLEWQAQVLKITKGKGVDVVFDPVGLLNKSLKVAAWDCRLVVVGFAGRRKPPKTTSPRAWGASTDVESTTFTVRKEFYAVGEVQSNKIGNQDSTLP